jgi:hypothetical protein
MSAPWNRVTASARRLPVVPWVCRLRHCIGACCPPLCAWFGPRRLGIAPNKVRQLLGSLVPTDAVLR